MHGYLRLLDDVMTLGEKHKDRTGIGTTSLFGYQWRHNLQRGFPLLTTKRLPLRWIFAELRWFLSGSTDESELRKEGVDIWKEWATEEKCAKWGRKPGQLGPIYGTMMRSFPLGHAYTSSGWEMAPDSHPYCDQIKTIIEEVGSMPDSRRLLVSHWHPYWSRKVELPACHTFWQLKVHNSALEEQRVRDISMQVYMRSADAFLGVPFNIASYALLLTMIARTCNLFPRELIFTFGDLHIYNNHHEQVKEQLSRDCRRLPDLVTLNRRENLWDYVWEDVDCEGYDPHPAIPAPVAV